MIYFILYFIFVMVSSKLTYKRLRNIDVKERKFLKEWELNYINTYKDLWREAYFEKLAEEKKIRKIELETKKEKEDIKERLKEVELDDSFRETYDIDLEKAIKLLEEKEKEI